jgi:sugar-specific transcriptional regulator TrmB
MDLFKNPLYRDLEKLNYSSNESKIYLTLLNLGPSLAGKVSKEAQLDRSSTYNALNALIKRGVVSTLHENKRTIFVPENPTKILDYYKEKEEIAKQLIPALEKQFSFQKKESAVKLYQGYKGVKTVFQDILASCDKGSTYYYMGGEGMFGQKMPYYAPMFVKLKEEKNITSKSLIREGRIIKEKTHNLRKTIPSEVVSPANISVYKDKVAIIIWDDTPKGIIIENADVSKTLESYFKFMWEHAKKI